MERIVATKKIAMVVADENVKVRNLVVARLEREPSFEIVGLADDSVEAVRSVLQTHPQILLIDPRMKDDTGFEAIRQLRAESPETVVVVLTSFCETAQEIELAKLGVQLILNKGLDSNVLVAMLQRAAQSTTDSVPKII